MLYAGKTVVKNIKPLSDYLNRVEERFVDCLAAHPRTSYAFRYGTPLLFLGIGIGLSRLATGGSYIENWRILGTPEVNITKEMADAFNDGAHRALLTGPLVPPLEPTHIPARSDYIGPETLTVGKAFAGLISFLAGTDLFMDRSINISKKVEEQISGTK